MASFQDEPEHGSGEDTWDRLLTLTALGKTVEVLRRSVGGQQQRVLRVWTGKRADGSNRVDADPDSDY
jgi:hypothetical protein